MSWRHGLLLVAWLVASAWATSARAEGERLALDEATVEQLAALPGMDAAFAADVVRIRDARGGLDSVEALRVLPGATPERLDALRAGTVVRFALPTGGGGRFGSPEEVLASFDKEPSVGEVQRWTSEYAQVQPEVVQRWLRASRAFAGLPQVRGSFQLRDSYSNDFRIYDEDGDPPVSNDVPVQSVRTDSDVGQTRTIQVWVTWDLDRLVMSSEQIRVINEAQDVVRLRERVLGEATRLYFERRRLQVDQLLNPKVDLLGQVRDMLRLRELTANIDALTGGRFSQALAGGT